MKNKKKLSFKTKFLNFCRIFFKIPVFEKHLAKLTRDKAPSSFVSKLVPNYYQYKPNTIRQVIRNKIKFKLDISDYLEHAAYFGFNYDDQTDLFNLCKEGDVIVDVGTNIGYVLLNFAQRVGKDGFVYGFEPNPFTYAKCVENIKLNDLSNIKVSNIGLGVDQTRGRIIVPYDRNRGAVYIEAMKASEEAKPSADIIYANITSLDRFTQENNINRIDLIKIDVEGFELNVLKGAKETLAKYRPKLFVEIDDTLLQRQNATSREVIKFISNFGYLIKRADTGVVIHDDYDFSNKHFDVKCLPE